MTYYFGVNLIWRDSMISFDFALKMRALNFILWWRIYIILSSLMIKGLILVTIIALVASIPYEDQITLANSLIVGRDDYSDLFNWECKVCDSTNKPIHTHPI